MRTTMIAKLALSLVLLVAGLAAGNAPVRAAELVMFDDPACVWCRRWHAEIGPSYPRSPEGQLAPLRRVLIREQAAAGVALASPIRGTPTFVLAQEGREVGRISGYSGADFFYPQLGELLAKLAPPIPDPTPSQRSTQAPSDLCAMC